MEQTHKRTEQIELNATRVTEHIVGILLSYLSVDTHICTMERISDITNNYIKYVKRYTLI
jgi:hypothetical protein